MDNQKIEMDNIKTDSRIIYSLRKNLGSIFGKCEIFKDYISANERIIWHLYDDNIGRQGIDPVVLFKIVLSNFCLVFVRSRT